MFSIGYQIKAWMEDCHLVHYFFGDIFLLFVLYGNRYSSYFVGCDPVLAGKSIEHHQSILPYFVDQIGDKVPGLMGLLLSGIIAAWLSITTSCWNTVACTIYEDLVKPHLHPNISKDTSSKILNGILLLVAVISTSIIPSILQMKSIIEATATLNVVSMSVYHILYNNGMFFPLVNSIGAFVGSLTSVAITIYKNLGTQRAKIQNLVDDLLKIPTMCGNTMEQLHVSRCW